MPKKDITAKTENQNLPEEVVLDVKVPATGVDVAAVLPEAARETPTESVTEAPADVPAEAAPVPHKVVPGRKMRGDPARRGGRGGPGQGRGGARGGRGEPRERVKPEFDSKIIDIRRVTRVAAGGRRYSFSVAVVAGDRKGRVGVGLGKGSDTALSVEKATREAKKNLIRVTLSPQMTIPHAVEGKYGSAVIKIFPARGRGMVAGSSARAVIELAGIRDVCAKFLSGSKNRLNNARAAIAALQKLSAVSRKMLHPERVADIEPV
ncbi:MAG: small subunit ribosomal protein [Candidatus Parcubacteria bacterium]|jgi:small subunit ribosomal protein S5|nr:small subunit ribosomal protein [Candidatus Parcubacteria bacterium]